MLCQINYYLTEPFSVYGSFGSRAPVFSYPLCYEAVYIYGFDTLILMTGDFNINAVLLPFLYIHTYMCYFQ